MKVRDISPQFPLGARGIPISTVAIIQTSNVLASKIRDKVAFIVFHQDKSLKLEQSPDIRVISGHWSAYIMSTSLECITPATALQPPAGNDLKTILIQIVLTYLNLQLIDVIILRIFSLQNGQVLSV